MVKVLFVCYGNICRSPMAEFLFKKYVKEKGVADKFFISSAATSSEEISNPVYPPVKAILNGMGIDCSKKRAVQISLSDYNNYDYVIGMETLNVSHLKRFFNDVSNKIYRLLDFDDTAINKDIADPWYTGDFNKAKEDIERGLKAFYEYLVKNKKIV